MIQIPSQLKKCNFVLLGKTDPKTGEYNCKAAYEGSWQKLERRIDNPLLQKHLLENKNYGVRGGSSSAVEIDGKIYSLIILDFDDRNTQDALLKQLPETFTVKTGGKGLLHLYFASDGDKSFKVLGEKDKSGKRITRIDVQGEGKQVVGPNSINDKTNKPYEVVKDVPIAFIHYEELLAIVMPYDLSEQDKKEKPIKKFVPKDTDTTLAEKVFNAISIEDAFREVGVVPNGDRFDCPVHASTSHRCVKINEDGTAKCFGCGKVWNAYSLIRECKNWSDKFTWDYFAQKAGLTEEVRKSRKEYQESKSFAQAAKSFATISGELDGDVNETTTTPSYLTTPYYIKSWGYFNKEVGIHIEQVTKTSYVYNLQGKKGISKVLTKTNDKGKFLYNYLKIEEYTFIFSKTIYDGSLFYNIPSIGLIQKYIAGQYTPRSYREIHADIKKALSEFFDFSSPIDIETSALHIGQSWIKPLRNTFFFYMIDSTLGGGKTTLGELVYFLMRHGHIAGNISSAAIPRLVDELDLNEFIDEIDQNKGDEDTLAILRKGQRRGNPYVRCEGRENKPIPYDVAGCHGGSFRSELEDAFMNRALRVHTKKSSDYRLPVMNSYKRELLKSLADELFIWHIEHLISATNCSKCSSVVGCSRTSEATTFSREDVYNTLISQFDANERSFLKEVIGRNNELTYLCLETSKILDIDILESLRQIMQNKTLDEDSSEGFYLDTLRQYLYQNEERFFMKRLKEGVHQGYPFFPKNRLYQLFVGYLRELNVSAIGTKKYTSLLRDLGFVEHETITSQRYDSYPTACLIFNKEICRKIGMEVYPSI